MKRNTKENKLGSTDTDIDADNVMTRRNR